MIALSKNEMARLHKVSVLRRKKKLKGLFLSEFESVDVEPQELLDFFEKGFAASLRLDAVTDKEILQLFRLGVLKRTHVERLSEFSRCVEKQKWSGRALFLSSAVEIRSEEAKGFRASKLPS